MQYVLKKGHQNSHFTMRVFLIGNTSIFVPCKIKLVLLHQRTGRQFSQRLHKVSLRVKHPHWNICVMVQGLKFGLLSNLASVSPISLQDTPTPHSMVQKYPGLTRNWRQHSWNIQRGSRRLICLMKKGSSQRGEGVHARFRAYTATQLESYEAPICHTGCACVPPSSTLLVSFTLTAHVQLLC